MVLVDIGSGMVLLRMLLVEGSELACIGWLLKGEREDRGREVVVEGWEVVGVAWVVVVVLVVVLVLLVVVVVVVVVVLVLVVLVVVVMGREVVDLGTFRMRTKGRLLAMSARLGGAGLSLLRLGNRFGLANRTGFLPSLLSSLALISLKRFLMLASSFKVSLWQIIP